MAKVALKVRVGPELDSALVDGLLIKEESEVYVVRTKELADGTRLESQDAASAAGNAMAGTQGGSATAGGQP